MKYIYSLGLFSVSYATEIALFLYILTTIVNIKIPIEWHYKTEYGKYYYVSANLYELFFIIGSLKLMNKFIEHLFIPVLAMAIMRLFNELCDILGVFSLTNEIPLSIEFFIIIIIFYQINVTRFFRKNT